MSRAKPESVGLDPARIRAVWNELVEQSIALWLSAGSARALTDCSMVAAVSGLSPSAWASSLGGADLTTVLQICSAPRLPVLSTFRKSSPAG